MKTQAIVLNEADGAWNIQDVLVVAEPGANEVLAAVLASGSVTPTCRCRKGELYQRTESYPRVMLILLL